MPKDRTPRTLGVSVYQKSHGVSFGDEYVFDLSDPSSFSAPTTTYLVPVPMKPRTGLPVMAGSVSALRPHLPRPFAPVVAEHLETFLSGIDADPS
jgi:hypothetical protein